MSRWRLLTAFSIVLLATGCGSTLRGGLSNAPRLGGSADEARVHDVIANGDDACASTGETAPQRGTFKLCSLASHPAPKPPWLPPLRVHPSMETDPDVPWLEHFYVGWPCVSHGPGGAVLASASTSTVGAALCQSADDR